MKLRDRKLLSNRREPRSSDPLAPDVKYQNRAMRMATFVRNELEDFHAELLTDEQMAQLNRLILNGIYTGMMAEKIARTNPRAQTYLVLHDMMAPKDIDPPALTEDFVRVMDPGRTGL